MSWPSKAVRISWAMAGATFFIGLNVNSTDVYYSSDLV